MNNLEKKLKENKPDLFEKYLVTKERVSKLLQQYVRNFPTYTDHSIEHTQEVLDIASDLLTEEEILVLNGDELYILCMACILHDIGMCIPESKIADISNTGEILEYRKNYPDMDVEKYIRDIHHILSYRFIMEEWSLLNIPSVNYAKAIGLVAQGHRKVNLSEFEVYDPRFFVKTGRESVCLPYLACVLRISDELDISNRRTPDILLKYYIPDSQISEMEWNKHKNTIQINYKENKVIIQAKCTDHNMLGAFEEQFDKIKNVIHECQKVIRSISLLDKGKFNISIDSVVPAYIFENFDPKGIKYSFEVKNVIKTFVGEELYENHDAALREAIQNSIDACNYKKSILIEGYVPEIKIEINENSISIQDNGQGMDEFIIENYFGKLASSFYQQEEIKNSFEAIGQFGIGVFSYFLISDYIDIETKRGESKSLKFRTDKDPNGYFHFFEDYERGFEGTTLTLHLKEDFKNKYGIGFMEKFLSKTFPFISIPIVVKDSSSEIRFEGTSMKIDFQEDVLKHFYFNSQKHKDDFKILSVSYSNEEFEGVLGAILPVKYELEEKKLSEIIDYTSFYDKGFTYQTSSVSFSQKGVFVNSFENRVSYTFGKINFIRKHKINLNRTDFISRYSTVDVLDFMSSKLLDNIFKEMLQKVKLNSENHCLKAKWFNRNFIQSVVLGGYSIEIIKKYYCFEIYLKNRRCYKTINDLSKIISKVIIVDSLISYERIKKNTDIPLMIHDRNDYADTSYIDVFEKGIQFGATIILLNGMLVKALDRDYYEDVEKMKKLFYRVDSYNGFFHSDLPLIALNLSSLKYQNFHEYPEDEDTCDFNVNHWLFKCLYQMNEEKVFNSLEIRIIKELFGFLNGYFISETSMKFDLEEVLSSCNSIISKINSDRGNRLGDLTEADLIN